MKKLKITLLTLLTMLVILPVAYATEITPDMLRNADTSSVDKLGIASMQDIPEDQIQDFFGTMLNPDSNFLRASSYGSIMPSPWIMYSTWERYETIYFPILMSKSSYSSDGWALGIFDSRGEMLAYTDGSFQTGSGAYVLTLYWDSQPAPGTYTMVMISDYADESYTMDFYVSSSSNPGNIPTYTNHYFYDERENIDFSKPNNYGLPLSAWDFTIVDAPSGTPDYAIKLLDLYMGTPALEIVKDENMYNPTPLDGMQWVLMSFYIYNFSDNYYTLEVDDILAARNIQGNFWTSYGTQLTVNENAVFSNYLDGYSSSDVYLYPGEEGIVWIGIMTKINQGIPYIRLETSQGYTYLNADPSYHYPYNRWVYYEGDYYYLDSTGKFVTGWQIVDDEYVYFHPNGAAADGLTYIDGAFYYMKRGVLQSEYTGLVYFAEGFYYVENGILNANYTGLIFFEDYFYYVEGGKLNSGYTGLVYFADQFYYVEGGVLNTNYTGLIYFADQFYYVENGILNSGYTGLIYFADEFYYIENGWLNSGYTGLIYFADAFYYVENGKLNSGYTGLVYFADVFYYVENGVLNFDYAGLIYCGSAFYFVENGTLNWGYTGLVWFYDAWYYVNAGVLDFSYSGVAYTPDGTQYNVIGGIAQP